MASVTQVIRETKQPRGGFVRPAAFEKTVLDDGKILSTAENISPITVGTVVDYMTRFASGTKIPEAFSISIRGAINAQLLGYPNALEECQSYLDGITGIDDASIRNACLCVPFDEWMRNPFSAVGRYMAGQREKLIPDEYTIGNIRTMVQRGVDFFKEYGPVTKDGFDFSPNGYTDRIKTGDGDFLTKDTLWDFKTSKNGPTNKHTMQLLMYWIMGKHSGNSIFDSITKIGIFNPRLNTVWTLNTSNIPRETIREVEQNIIGYTNSLF